MNRLEYMRVRFCTPVASSTPKIKYGPMSNKSLKAIEVFTLSVFATHKTGQLILVYE